MKCAVCKETDKESYITFGPFLICNECDEKPEKKPHFSIPRIFSRWVCKTHNCGSYNFNLVGKHEMDNCDITREDTVGVVKPKTFGGRNGDLHRKWWKTENDIFVILNSRWKISLIGLRTYYGISTRRRKKY